MDIEITIISKKSEHRAMFYYKGHIYTFYGDTPKEAKLKAENQIKVLKGESLF